MPYPVFRQVERDPPGTFRKHEWGRFHSDIDLGGIGAPPPPARGRSPRTRAPKVQTSKVDFGRAVVPPPEPAWDRSDPEDVEQLTPTVCLNVYRDAVEQGHSPAEARAMVVAAFSEEAEDAF